MSLVNVHQTLAIATCPQLMPTKPQPPLPPKPVPKVGEEATSTVNDGRGQGDGGTASADIGDTGLDIDASKPEVATDEV